MEKKFTIHKTNENINKGHDGEEFELFFGKLILYRLIKQKFKNFGLTREKTGCGKFDDLVFVYETDVHKIKYRLVQLKCKSDKGGYEINYEDLTTNPNSYFLLPFYYDHYIESLNSLSKDQDLKDANLEELILCTNVGINESLGCIYRYEIPNSELFHKSGNLYKLFIEDPQKRREIFPDQFLSDRKRLSKELVLCVMLKKSVNIQSMIHDETFSLIKTFYKMLVENVIDLKGKKFKYSFLNNDFNDNNELVTFRVEFFDSLIEFYENYKDKSTEELLKLIDFGRFKNVTDQNSKVNTLRSVLKHFNCKELVKFLEKREITFTGIPTEDTDVIFPSGEINEKNVDKNILTFLELLTIAANQKRDEDLISSEINNLFIYKGFNVYMNNWYYGGAKEKYRNWISEQNFLEELFQSSILFQNKKIKFSDICTTSDSVTPEILMYKFSNDKMWEMGKVIEKERIHFYIDRIFTQKKKVISNVFMEASDCIIIITLEGESHLALLQEKYPSDIEIKDLNYFDENNLFYYTTKEFDNNVLLTLYNNKKDAIKEKNIHWVKYIGNDLKYEFSYPTLSSFIEEYCQNDKHFTVFNLIKNEKFIIVQGDPGTGKTVLLEHVSNTLESENDYVCWLIMIPLNKYQKIIDEFESLDNIDCVINFLSKVENCEDEFSKNILRRFLLEESRIIIFLDGFDEVRKSKNREKILNLLRFLKCNTLIKQTWITSRPNFINQLEDTLGFVSFEVEDITEEDQVTIVTEHWKAYHKNSSINIIKDNAINFVKKFNLDINNFERSFLGIPLHTYMFAISYKNEAIKMSPNYPQRIGLVRLYDDFIYGKFSILFNQKIETDEEMQEDYLDIYKKKYQIFALMYSGIISPEDADLLNKKIKIELSEKHIEMLKKIGLIFETDNVYQFVHRTIAEYLIADLLLLVTDRDKDALSIVKEILLKRGNEFLLYVFDTHLTENCREFQIQKFVMFGEETSCMKLNKISLNGVDVLNRGCLYYALQYRQFTVMEHLIEKDIDLHFEIFFTNCIKNFLRYFEVNYYGNSKVKYLNKYYVILFNFILEKEEENSSKISYFNLENEIKYRHYDIAMKLIDKFNRKVESMNLQNMYVLTWILEMLDTSVEFLILFFFKACDGAITFTIQEEDLKKNKELINLAIISGLLNCETNKLKNIILKYGKLVLRVSEYFDLILNQYYMLDNLGKCMPKISLFSDYVKCAKIKSDNFTILCRFLTENGASSEHFNTKIIVSTEDEIFVNKNPFTGGFTMDSAFNLLRNKNPLFQDIKLRKLRSLKVSEEEKQFSKDLWNTLGEYMFVCDYNEETYMSDAIHHIVYHILKSSEGMKIFNLIRRFHENVSKNDLEAASFCFAEAKRRGWMKEISMARNEEGDNAKEMMEKLRQRISERLLQIKEEIQQA